MVDVDSVQQAVDAAPHLRPMLFPFGFIITRRDNAVDLDAFPLYGEWVEKACGAYRVLLHPDQKMYVSRGGDDWHVLVGHAYDPVVGLSDEQDIIDGLAAAYGRGEAEYLTALNRLTGLFVLAHAQGREIRIFGDAAAMQTVYYGVVNKAPYIASHAALVGTLCGLSISDYVQRLVESRFYHLFGRALPGDLSPYIELRRLVANHSALFDGDSFSVSRFYPAERIGVAGPGEAYDGAVEQATTILRKSMELVAEKWHRPGLSLTGGCDSQTTLSCIDVDPLRFRYFSYVSTPEEEVDAQAAAGICADLGLPHELIRIPDAGLEVSADFDAIAAILELNYGNIGRVNRKEVAKRIVLRDSDIDVEVKSWASEIARGYYYKRFSKRRFPRKPSPRYLTTLYKVFAQDRQLVRMTDEVFRDYMDRYLADEAQQRLSWVDLFFWEFRVGAWNGLVITGDHRFSFEIDIPYNNRLLLQAFLETPVEARILDQPHRQIRDRANPRVNELGVSIVNVKHTKARSYGERVYLELHSRLPF